MEILYLLQGLTRLLMVKIPFFKEVVVSSFTCNHCGNVNTGIDSASEIQRKGIRITHTVHNSRVSFLQCILKANTL